MLAVKLIGTCITFKIFQLQMYKDYTADIYIMSRIEYRIYIAHILFVRHILTCLKISFNAVMTILSMKQYWSECVKILNSFIEYYAR